jgi:hypothetical protein
MRTWTGQAWANAFVAIWITGLIASLVTGAAAFMLLPLTLGCLFTIGLMTNWHGMAEWTLRRATWRGPAELRLFRWVMGGGGFLLCAFVTVALWTKVFA